MRRLKDKYLSQLYTSSCLNYTQVFVLAFVIVVGSRCNQSREKAATSIGPLKSHNSEER